MRQYSDSERSSEAASLARSVQSPGGTRSFSSSVHFSVVMRHPTKRRPARGVPGRAEKPAERYGGGDNGELPAR